MESDDDANELFEDVENKRSLSPDMSSVPGRQVMQGSIGMARRRSSRSILRCPSRESVHARPSFISNCLYHRSHYLPVRVS